MNEPETTRYSTIDLRTKMGEMVDRVRLTGQPAAITRRGKDMVYVVPREMFEQMMEGRK